MAEQVTIVLDGREVAARKGEMVIAAAERAGVYIPRFCYHPRMRPVGMCRMCLVHIKGPRGFSLQPACFVPVADGQEIVTPAPEPERAPVNDLMEALRKSLAARPADLKKPGARAQARKGEVAAEPRAVEPPAKAAAAAGRRTARK